MKHKGLLASAAVVAGLGAGALFVDAFQDTVKRVNGAHQEQIGAQPNLLTQWVNSTVGEASAEPVAVIPAAAYDAQPDPIAKLINSLDI